MKTLTPRQINAARRKEGKPPLNFKLIRQILHKIETTPESYDQGVWGRESNKAPCGTAACIAGWACYFGGRKSLQQLRRNPRSAEKVALKLIGLNEGDWFTESESGMFDGFADSWPNPFRDRFQLADTPRKQARAAIAYLKHVLRTGQVVE